MANRDSTKYSYHAIIPAAGCGSRFKTDPPKQLFVINGQPIIKHTVEVFSRCGHFDNIVVVIPDENSEHHESIKNCLRDSSNIQYANGGSSRHRSVFNGLICLDKLISKNSHPFRTHAVVIHDGVRPLVNTSDIVLILQATVEHGAAGLVVPLTSTVLKANSEMIMDYGLDRTVHFASEMPQGFLFKEIIEAYKKCTPFELDHGTECLEVMRKYSGVSAKLIEGDANRLWKVTHAKDITALTSYWASNSKTE